MQGVERLKYEWWGWNRFLVELIHGCSHNTRTDVSNWIGAAMRDKDNGDTLRVNVLNYKVNRSGYKTIWMGN